MSTAAARRARLEAMRRELAEKEASQGSTDTDAELAEIERRRKEREAARRRRLGLDPEPEPEPEPAKPAADTAAAATTSDGKAEASDGPSGASSSAPAATSDEPKKPTAEEEFAAFMAAKRAARLEKQKQDAAKRQEELGITDADLQVDAAQTASSEPAAAPTTAAATRTAAGGRLAREPAARMETAAERKARRQAELEEKARQREAESQKQKDEYEAKLRAEKEAKEAAERLDAVYKGDRLHKDVPFPQYIALGSDLLFDGNGIPRHALLRDHLAQEGRLHLDAAFELIDKAGKIFYDEPSVLEISGPVVVVGDIHGQFYDLLHMMNETGLPPATTYLFLGDYVDRGMFSTEVCFYLYALKLCFPRQVYLLRGNHECRSITAHFNFMKECTFKYTMGIYQSFINTFDFLPLAAIIANEGKRFLCLHGGIGPKMRSLEDIKALNRYREPLEAGVLVDILWADPEDEDACETMSPDEIEDWKMIEFEPNQARGCSYTFGYSAIQDFLQRNNFEALLRGHSVMQKGYKKHFTLDNTGPPLVYTIFSAPNYCGKYQNLGAYARVRDDVQTYTFVWTAPPYTLPDFQSCISLSIGRIAETVRNVVSAIVQFLSAETDESDTSKTKMVSAVVKQIVLSNEPIRIDPTRQVKYKDNLDAFLAASKELSSSELRPAGIDWNRLSRTISSPSLTMQIQMRDVKTEKANRLRRTGTLTPAQLKATALEAQKLQGADAAAAADVSAQVTPKAAPAKLTAMDFAAQIRLWKQEHAQERLKAAAAVAAPAAAASTPAGEPPATPSSAGEPPLIKRGTGDDDAASSSPVVVVEPLSSSSSEQPQVAITDSGVDLPSDLPELEPAAPVRETSKKDLKRQERKALKKLLAAEEKRRQDEERLRRQQQKNEERVRRRLEEERLREEEEERKRVEREAKERAKLEAEERKRKEIEERKREKAEKKKKAKEEEERRKKDELARGSSATQLPAKKASKLNILASRKHDDGQDVRPDASSKPKPERTESRKFAMFGRAFNRSTTSFPAVPADAQQPADPLANLLADIHEAEQTLLAAQHDCEEAERAALLAEKRFRAAQADLAAKRAVYERELEKRQHLDAEAELSWSLPGEDVVVVSSSGHVNKSSLESSGDDKPSVETTRSVVEPTRSVVETTSPSVETTSPSVETTSPSVETSPVVETSPPVETTSPVVETSPIVETTSPVVETTTTNADPVRESSSSSLDSSPSSSGSFILAAAKPDGDSSFSSRSGSGIEFRVDAVSKPAAKREDDDDDSSDSGSRTSVSSMSSSSSSSSSSSAKTAEQPALTVSRSIDLLDSTRSHQAPAASSAAAKKRDSTTSDSSYDESEDSDSDSDSDSEPLASTAELIKSAIQRQRLVVQEAQLKFESEARELKEIVAILRDPDSAQDTELLNRLEARLQALTISHPQSKAYYKEQREKLNVLLDSSQARAMPASFRGVSKSLASLDSNKDTIGGGSGGGKDTIIKEGGGGGGGGGGGSHIARSTPLDAQSSRVLVKNPALTEFRGKDAEKRHAIEATLKAWAAGDAPSEGGDGSSGGSSSKDMRRSVSAKLNPAAVAPPRTASSVVEPATLAPPAEEKRRGLIGRLKDRRDERKRQSTILDVSKQKDAPAPAPKKQEKDKRKDTKRRASTILGGSTSADHMASKK